MLNKIRTLRAQAAASLGVAQYFFEWRDISVLFAPEECYGCVSLEGAQVLELLQALAELRARVHEVQEVVGRITLPEDVVDLSPDDGFGDGFVDSPALRAAAKPLSFFSAMYRVYGKGPEDLRRAVLDNSQTEPAYKG